MGAYRLTAAYDSRKEVPITFGGKVILFPGARQVTEIDDAFDAAAEKWIKSGLLEKVAKAKKPVEVKQSAPAPEVVEPKVEPRDDSGASVVRRRQVPVAAAPAAPAARPVAAEPAKAPEAAKEAPSTPEE